MRTHRYPTVLVVLVVLVAISSQVILAQEAPRVGVTPLVQNTDDPNTEALADEISWALSANIGLLGTHDVQLMDEPITSPSSSRLNRYAVQERLDNVIYGSISKPDSQTTEFVVAMYDRGEGEVVYENSWRINSIFEIFDTVDLIVESMLEQFADERLAFGRIVIRNTGTDGEYRVYLNDQLLGNDLTQSRIIAGTHQIRIDQDRMFGVYTVIDQDITVSEGGSTTVTIEIPIVTDEESERIDAFNERISFTEASDRGEYDFPSIIDQYVALKQDIEFATYSAALQSRRRQLEIDFNQFVTWFSGEDEGAQSTASLEPRELDDANRYVAVSGATFRMGSRDDSGGETESHFAVLGDFTISATEVTFEEYDRYVESENVRAPSDQGWGRGERPVVDVSWLDAIKYANWLSSRDGLDPAYEISGDEVIWNQDANGWRLPTEAEWEFAAKGGSQGEETDFAGSDEMISVAWYSFNAGNQTQPVAMRSPNELGAYDLSGNVEEWVWDWYDPEYYQRSPRNDPTGPTAGDERVVRGGSFRDNVGALQVTSRGSAVPSERAPYRGFRLVKSEIDGDGRTPGTYAEGYRDGKQMADGKNIYFAAGFCLGAIGIIIPYVVQPDVPSSMLMGKSPDYARGFENGFKEETRKQNIRSAAWGYGTCCGVGCGVYWLLYAAAIVSLM